MAYTIRTTANTVIATINDGFLDSTTSLRLPGPNYVGYGQYLNENLIYLLENFASDSSRKPTGSLEGQLWYNKTSQQLNVFTSTGGYQPVTGTVVASDQPLNPKTGDSWLNTATNQYYLFDGSGYTLIGPQYTKSQNISGAIPVTILDSLSTTKNILKLQFGNVVVATISQYPTFAPSDLPGFPSVNPGITFNNTIPTPIINTNVIGNLTGSVVGSLTGPVNGNLTGNVIATTLTGTLTGNVIATTLTGTLDGDVNATNISVTNLITGNAQITGGSLSGITNLSSVNGLVTNLVSGNAIITSGTLSGIASITATAGSFTNLNSVTKTATNFSTGNAQITGGSLSGITRLNTNNLFTSNLSTGNAVITGGFVNNITALTATTGTFQNLTTSTIAISGGSVSGLTHLATTTADVVNLSTGNAQITGGNIVNTPIVNANVINANLINATTTTQATNDRTSALATTSFVHNVMPTGMIVMWGGLASAIPAGWALCDGVGGRPDLRDKFIVGSGTTYAVGDTGGTNSINLTSAMLPAHTHSFSVTANTTSAGAHTHSASTTVTDPGHAHSTSNYATPTFGGGNWYPGNNGTTNSGTGSAVTGISASTSIVSAANHLHSVTIAGNTSQTGANQSIDNRPPYYALCFIQKVY